MSARESQSGKPIAVMGPQTAYFAPQLLLDVDVHGPGIDARGATFAGVSLYVLLGHGRDYAWSATSAGQDIIDTFALPLCEPDGSAPSVDSMHYLFRGQCTAIEVLEKTNNWTPSPADDTPPGSETLHAERTKLGLVTARATLRGKPVIYTKLRSTYFHEADSALGFVELNDPSKIRGPEDFQRAASKIGFTFNWFYVDHSHIGYFNSGNNPVRAARTSSHFPVSGRFEWRGWNPDLWSASYTPASRHPQAIDQAFLANWNNKQARGYRAADDNFGYGSVYRSQSLSDRIRKGTRGSKKMSLVQLIDAMEVGGHGRPARDQGAALGAQGRRPAARPEAAPRGLRAAGLGARRRTPARPRPQRRLRARGGDLDPRPLVVALAAGSVPADARGGPVQAAARR